MSGWNQFSNEEDTADRTDSAFDQNDDSATFIDDASETNPDEESAGAAAGDEPESKKTRPATARKRAAGTLTRAQVQRVLDLRDELTEANDELVKLLAFITKAEASADELTVALLTHSPGGDDALSEISQLLEAADDNPFRLSAQLTGMDRPTRNRVHGVLVELSGNDDTLPRDDVNAAVMLAGLISGLNESQRALIKTAIGIRGQ